MYFIAEAGSNFNQSLDTAFRLIEASSQSGASAVKFQLFQADALYPKGSATYELFKSIQLNSEWLPQIISCCEDNNVDFMASCFDFRSFDTLEKHGVKAHKVASSELSNGPLLAKIAKTRKRTYVSTGMSGLSDVLSALEIFSQNNSSDLCVMQCTAQYPCPDSDSNVGALSHLRSIWTDDLGFSDHTMDSLSACLATALGATTFEKTITLSRLSPGPDHSYAIEPHEFQAYVSDIQRALTLIGNSIKSPPPQEASNCRRTSAHASVDITPGSSINSSMIEYLRPLSGIPKEQSHAVIGLKAAVPIAKGQPITWETLS